MISNSMWILTGNQFLSFITQTYSIFCIFSPRVLNTTHTFTYLTNITLTLLLLIPFPPPQKKEKKKKKKTQTLVRHIREKKKKDQKICKKLTIWRMHKNGTADEHNEPASVPENSRLERNNREPPLWLQEIADPLMDLKQGMETLRVNKTFRGILSTLLSIGIFLNGNEVGIECQPNDIRLIRQSESVVRAESISISVDDFRVIVVRWFGKRDEYRFMHFPQYEHHWSVI